MLNTESLNFLTKLYGQDNMNLVFELNRSNKQQGKLFLGNINAANNKQYLKSHGVQAVLSVIDNGEVNLNPKIAHLRIVAQDEDEFNLTKYFDQATKFIKCHLETTNVLVHCFAGISRSATIVIAYLIRYHNMRMIEAIQHVKKRRPQIEPNIGFMKQLEQYDRKCRGYPLKKGSPTIEQKNQSLERFIDKQYSFLQEVKPFERITQQLSTLNILLQQELNLGKKNSESLIETPEQKQLIQNSYLNMKPIQNFEILSQQSSKKLSNQIENQALTDKGDKIDSIKIDDLKYYIKNKGQPLFDNTNNQSSKIQVSFLNQFNKHRHTKSEIIKF